MAEGDAVRVSDVGRPREWAARPGGEVRPVQALEVRNGRFHHGPGHAYVFSVAPRTVFGFGEGEPFSRTRSRFDLEEH